MADPKQPAAGSKPAGTQNKDAQADMVASGQLAGADVERDVTVRGRLEASAPPPKHGDPTEQAPPALGETVLGVRVGSEAAVESGTDPVLPAAGAPLSEATRVRNRDLRDRDQKEFRKRGLRSDGTLPTLPRAVSVSFEGMMIIEIPDEEADGGVRKETRSGSFTGIIPADGITIRPPTPEEEAEATAGPGAQKARRADDLAHGSGAGGGGNPMIAGQARGVADPSRVGGPGAKATSSIAGVGTGGTTSRG